MTRPHPHRSPADRADELSRSGPASHGPAAASVRARVPLTSQRAARTGARAVHRDGPRAEGRHSELVSFRGLSDGREHIAYVAGPLPETPLVRVHSECFTGDVLGSTRCDCGPQLDEALRRIGDEGGVLLYLRQEGRGIGLYNKLDAYLLQDQHIDTYQANLMIGRQADERDYRAAAQMLAALGVRCVRLLTNNPVKVRRLVAHGVTVAERVPTLAHVTNDNVPYLRAKQDIGGHRFRSAVLSPVDTGLIGSAE
ncbi:GTP cyclohydrolase II [Streptomyces beigongshangae]|uniref:GTP cyclohydrolase II n=1 Tax=Streptomyces beigongshangae TaxID=2841597 RepID=UPI001C84AE49|nr:GTP cyclohydrolase II [Streptomyces sp. REN17]